MVRLVVAMAALALTQGAAAERPVFDAESLKRRLESEAAADQRAGERLKASRGNVESLRVLDDEDLTYELPNGRFVPGMLLPNGKLAPALVTRGGRRPACVTRAMDLVPGRYKTDEEAIQCELAREELAVLDGEGADQVSSVGPENGAEPEGLSRADKYGGGQGPPPETVETVEPPTPGQAPTAAPAVPVNPNLYVPPGRNAGNDPGVGVVLARDENHFGVPIGTWVEAELLRRVSSAESGFIEFETLEDIKGSHQVFPAGTVLFAKKRINESSRRLESVTVTARLPEGREVRGVRFRVYSLDKTAGLNGELIRNREGELASAGKHALLDAAGEVAVQAGDNVAAGMASEVKDDLVSREKRYAGDGPEAVIQVPPQRVLLQVVEGF